MRIRLLSLLVALSAVLAVAPAARAQAAGVVGKVDTQKVFQNYKDAQEAQSRFRREAQAYQEELADDQKKLEEAKKAKKPEDEIAKMQKRFEEDLKPKKSRVEALDRELSGKIKKDIEQVIADVAKSKGIATVLDKQVVLYGGVDLSDEVLKRLNK